MAKVKITKSELPNLDRDIEIDSTVLKKIQAIHKEHQAEFEKQIEDTRREALERFTQKVEALKKAKSEMTKHYDEEIKKIEDLIKNLKAANAEVVTAQPKPSKRKVIKKSSRKSDADEK